MTERIVRVIVDPSGARQGLRVINQETQKTERGFGNLRGAIAGAIAVLGVRELAELADTYTLVNNRIKLVTESQGEQVRIQRELLDLANQTRTPLEATVELYGRVARSTDELGISQQEVLDLTESVNQAIQISGATASEAGAGVIQFAQGLASGALRGDELRSVLEQTPRLAEALADGLGVGIGQLRELGTEGELTAEKVIGALKKSAPSLAAEFADIAPTIEGSFTVLNNEILNFVGQVDQSLGISAAFGRNIQDLASVIGDLTDDTVLFGLALKENISLAFAEGAAFIDEFLVRFERFRNTLVGTAAQASDNSANVIGDVFGEDVEQDFRDNIGQITELVVGAIPGVGSFSEELGEIVGNSFKEGAVDSLVQARVEIDRTFDQQIEDIRKRRDETIALIEESSDRAVIDFIEGAGAGDVDLTKARGDGAAASSGISEQAEKTQAAAAKLLETYQQQSAELAAQLTFGDAAEEILRRNGVEELARAGATAETVNSLRAITTELAEQEEIQRQRAAAAEDIDLISGLEQELELLEATEEQRFRILAIQQLSVNATEDQIEATAALLEAIDASTESQRTQLITLEEIDREFTRGVGNAIGDFVRNFDEGFDSIRDSFADLLTDLAAQILQNIIITQFLNSIGQGGGSGGLISGVVGAFTNGQGGQGAQFGGPVSAGRPVIIGEGNRPEVFIPSQAGRVEPIANLGGGQQPVTIINSFDPMNEIFAQETARGRQVQRNNVVQEKEVYQRVLGR